ncbi:MAG: hypothetical protein KAS12_04450, partial [Candidatus Aenigmarchaeota archaeon]|nr:hypothetical protein [Candidatus Aenigmarchaeota archaeon]
KFIMSYALGRYLLESLTLSDESTLIFRDEPKKRSVTHDLLPKEGWDGVDAYLLEFIKNAIEFEILSQLPENFTKK